MDADMGVQTVELDKIMGALSEKRPVFHSEADFQHALAWEIQRAYPDSRIRLEYVAPELRYHLDILVHAGGEAIPIELKYKTRRGVWTVEDERFEAVNQSARDIARYDFIKDIFRVEQMVSAFSAPYGYAVLLTNESSYWRPGRSADTIDAAFKLHDGRLLTGELAWKEHAGAGTTKGRAAPLILGGRYPLHWQDYSLLDESGAGRFRCLAVRVTG